MKKFFGLGIIFCLLLGTISGCFGPSDNGPNPSPSPTPVEGSAAPVVVFLKNGEFDNGLVYKQNIDGSGTAVLVSPDTDETCNFNFPSLSHDNKKVVFTDLDARYIYVVGINHNGAALPAPLFDAGGDNVYFPVFSNDGAKIAFRMSCAVPAFSGIYVINISTGSYAKIPNSPASANHPSWSPDGATIVYQNESDSKLYTISSNTEGTDTPHLLLPTGSTGFFPCWSWMDNQIAYTNSTGIALITYGGSSVTQLTTGESETSGYWSSDGTKVIFERGGSTQFDIFSIRITDKLETNITNTPGENEDEFMFF